MARRDGPERVLSSEQAAELGALAAKPLSESAAPAIRRALAGPAKSRANGRSRGSSTGRGGVATGSATSPLHLAGGAS